MKKSENSKTTRNLKLFLDSEELVYCIIAQLIIFTEYNNKAKLQNKPELSEETKKFLYSLDELNKISIVHSYTLKKKIFKGLKEEDITKLNQINRVRIGKFPYNINKENKIQCSKRNFKSCNDNYEEQNNSDSDSDLSFNFCFIITTNIWITYPNGQSDRIYEKKKKKKVCTKEYNKNNNFSIGEVFYAPIIQNNLISIHYLRIKGFNKSLVDSAFINICYNSVYTTIWYWILFGNYKISEKTVISTPDIAVHITGECFLLTFFSKIL
ncbi:hypothetical protein H8356DRAFT_1419669 [Neocallimastix lanati (nom. inval.)]|nr:hypothetical protein H8356DRAFT_1419669 [Neocallimastix sp. JGI-2020a]